MRPPGTFDLEGTHELHVGSLTTPLQLRVLRAADGTFFLEPSHFLKTAIQYLPHAYQGPFTGTRAEAIAELAGALAGFFEQAVRRGYPPCESWLVPNTLFGSTGDSGRLSSDAPRS